MRCAPVGACADRTANKAHAPNEQPSSKEDRRGAPLSTSDVESSSTNEHGARLLVDSARAAKEISRMRGAGEGDMSTEEILALTRR
jgi:hypothetical protein